MTRISMDDQMIVMVGNRLREVRYLSKLSIAEVCESVDCSTNSLWQMESAKKNTNFVIIARLCKLYGISIDSLVYSSDNEFGITIKERFGDAQ